jgi:hypothetical protein
MGVIEELTLQEEFVIFELIHRRTKQLIVHSYLYYHLNESVILDSTFDLWCKELCELKEKYSDIAAQTPYWKIGQKFDATGSGFFITQYPNELMLQANILVYGFGGKGKKGSS